MRVTDDFPDHVGIDDPTILSEYPLNETRPRVMTIICYLYLLRI